MLVVPTRSRCISGSVYLTDTIRLQQQQKHQQFQPALLLHATFLQIVEPLSSPDLRSMAKGPECLSSVGKAERQRERNELRPIQVLGRTGSKGCELLPRKSPETNQPEGFTAFRFLLRWHSYL